MARSLVPHGRIPRQFLCRPRYHSESKGSLFRGARHWLVVRLIGFTQERSNRASDARRDVRRDNPYGLHPLLIFRIPVDVGKRGTVRDMAGSGTMAIEAQRLDEVNPCGCHHDRLHAIEGRCVRRTPMRKRAPCSAIRSRWPLPTGSIVTVQHHARSTCVMRVLHRWCGHREFGDLARHRCCDRVHHEA